MAVHDLGARALADVLVALRARRARLVHPRRGYALALLLPALAAASVVAIIGLREPARLVLGDVNPVRLVVIFFVFAVVDGPLGEEIGWRGFLLPRLLEAFRPLSASLLIGAVWFLWHLPLYAAVGDRTLDLAFFGLYLTLNVSYAVLHTWFFLRSGGSTFLAVFFHTAGNYFVFLSLSLFPALRQVEAVRMWHTAALALFALIAAISLMRRDGPGLARTDEPRPAVPRQGGQKGWLRSSLGHGLSPGLRPGR